MGDGTENTSQNTRTEESTEDSLDEDRVLDLAQRGLLDPNLTVKDFADDVALLVSCNPRLIFVAVGAVADKRLLRYVLGLDTVRVVIGEEFPRSQVAVVHAVQDNTHAFPCGDESRDADQEQNDGQDTPRATSAAKHDENRGDNTKEDGGHSEAACEDDTGLVAIADCPADEVGVALTS